MIAGRATPADGPAKCFGFVQTYNTKPKRRLFDLLISQGMQANQAVTFLTDGGDDVRDLPLYLNPDSEHLLGMPHRFRTPDPLGSEPEWRIEANAGATQEVHP